jgi:hypothetical protein
LAVSEVHAGRLDGNAAAETIARNLARHLRTAIGASRSRTSILDPTRLTQSSLYRTRVDEP